MLAVQFTGVVLSGEEDLDSGITDLMITDGPSGPVLVSVSQMQGGFVSYALAEGSVPVVVRTKQFETFLLTGDGPSLVAIDGGFLATGLASHEVITYDIVGAGEFQNPQRAFPGNENWTHVANLNDEKIILASEVGNTFSVFDAGTFELIVTKSDGGTSYARDIADLDVATVGGTDYLVTASASELGVSLYEITQDNAIRRGSVDSSDGIGLMIPTDIEIVVVGAETFVLVANAPTSFGAGAITVMHLDPGGELVPTDHVLDTLDSRFAQVQSLAAVEYNGIGLVAAGGGDDGISLFAVLPGGRLVHLQALPDSVEAGLDNVSHIEAAVIGETLHIYVAAQAEFGVTLLTADLSGLGVGRVAGEVGGALSGTSADDILVDGAGVDALWGGNGADLFVFGTDGQTDEVRGFNPAQDKLDLSAWMQLYDPDALDIQSTSFGATIRWRGEVLDLYAASGNALDPEVVRSTVSIDINRSFFAPDMEMSGGGANDRLEGSWGMDRLDGGAGDDTLIGGAGDDTLTGGAGQDTFQGGAGQDTAILGYSTADLTAIEVEGTTVTLTTAIGDEVATDVETFTFSDDTLTFDEVASYFAPQTLSGTNGADTLNFTGKSAHLFGGDGNDDLTSGNFDDQLFGGSGSDTLEAQGGDDLIDGGAGTDRVRLAYQTDDLTNVMLTDTEVVLTTAFETDTIRQVEFFEFSDATYQLSDLFGFLPTVTLTGGDGNDQLTAVGNRAVLSGGRGNDTLIAGHGHDTLFGGDGDDVLRAGGGNDTLYGGAGDDSIVGDAGFDRLFLAMDSADVVAVGGGGGTYTITSPEGVDVVTGIESFVFDDVTLSAVELASLFGPETIEGSDGPDVLAAAERASVLLGFDGDDILNGDVGDDILEGGEGADELRGLQGNDAVFGGAGDDQVWTHSGNDTIYGDEGNDTLRGGPDQDLIYGGGGDDQIRGQRHSDTLHGGGGHDNIKGGGGNDVHFGNGGNDFIKGGTYHDIVDGGWGNDTISGNRGEDSLFGNRGNDTLRGGGGDDYLHGGGDDDLLYGGAGADVFSFSVDDGADLLADFDLAFDRIAFSDELAGALVEAAQVVNAYASVTAQGVRFDFGGGNSLLLEGIMSLEGLSDLIDIA